MAGLQGFFKGPGVLKGVFKGRGWHVWGSLFRIPFGKIGEPTLGKIRGITTLKDPKQNPIICARVDQLPLFPYNRAWEKSTQVRDGVCFGPPEIRIPVMKKRWGVCLPSPKKRDGLEP